VKPFLLLTFEYMF